MGPCFSAQGNASTVEPQTYLYYIQLRPSQPSQDVWVPYDEKAEQTIREDFLRLWATSFLDDLPIECHRLHVPQRRGRARSWPTTSRSASASRSSNYEGSKQIDRTKIDEQLRERGIELRLDSFLDDGVIRRIKTVLREMMAEKGFTNARGDHKITPVAGGPKLVNVTFNVSEGPKIKIRDVEFIGNTANSDGTLQKKLKENKPKGLLGLITGGGTYKEAKFEEDADRIVELLPERRLRARPRRPARAEGPRGFQGRQGALDRSCASR